MKITKSTIVILLITSSIPLYAQEILKELPVLVGIEIRALVNVNEEGVFKYSYAIQNDSSSSGNIFQFEIDLRFSGTQLPDTTGLIEGDSFENRAFRRIYPTLKGRIVPVGFSGVPDRWNTIITKSLKLNFGGYPLIKPGGILGPFTVKSYGVPSIRRITVRPQFDVDEYFPSINDTLPIFNFKEMDTLKKSTYYFLESLGPWLPDSTLSLESFTDTLETFRFRSCEELGWANDTTVCGQLENQLSEVKTALQNQDSVQAANVLAEFIELVKAEIETSLTSEGYALLFFNSEYLAERLRGED